MLDVDYDSKEQELSIKVNYSYPKNDDYDVIAYLENINLDQEKERDLQTGKGFIIYSPKPTLKKDIKNPNSIFSTKFGQRLGDANPFMDRFSCQCGELKSSINDGIECPKCHTICRRVDDDFSIFGWIEITKEYAIISPPMYKLLDQFFGSSKIIKDKKTKRGSVLLNMLDFDKEMDQNGFIIGEKTKPGEPYYGIGMIDFINRFDEILEFYYKKNRKHEIYNEILMDKENIFVNSIPVFTSHLRPMDISQGSMYYEKTNGLYMIMVTLAQRINRNTRKMDRNAKLKNQQLFRLQSKYMELYDEIVEILNGKKGQLRNLVAGRFNFTSRSVIKQNPGLRIDQCELPYVELVITCQMQIINVLHRLYNISYQEAYDKWFSAVGTYDQEIADIIDNLIKSSGEGIPVMLNRNPTITFGGIMQMFCVGFNKDYTLSVPLQILTPMAADFDGDTNNVFHIINQRFMDMAYRVFNPRNNMYLSKVDGMCNADVLPMKDTLINANTLNDLTLHKYTPDEMAKIEAIKMRAELVL